MDAFRKLTSLAGAAVLALTLAAGPVLAVEEVPDEPAAEQTDGGGADEGEGGRIQLAETPKDRVGLLLLGFLIAITAGGLLTANRQLKGKRPQATGEFRWR